MAFEPQLRGVPAIGPGRAGRHGPLGAAVGHRRCGGHRAGVDDRGILQAAGLLFFVFAGYARIATIGEEVRYPQRTIPRAIPIALFITVAVYLVVGVAAPLAAGWRQ